MKARARRRLLLLLLVAALAGSVAGWAGTATATKQSLLVVAPPVHAQTRAIRCPTPKHLRSAFEAAARDTGLPLAMLVAVAKVESNFATDTVSELGARGVLQVLPSTAAELRLDPDEPSANVLAGARYLRSMLERFRSTDLALAAYNAGPTAVSEAGGAPSAAVETYIQNVTERWRSLVGCH
jgi:soluble lytic murein transglycosylase-like protein